MKKILGRNTRTGFIAAASVLTYLIAIASSSPAAQLKEARVTQVINDVKLLPGQAAPRPAVVNDAVRDDTAVRTGTASRSELTFPDLTITRLGANTIFSFNEGTRDMNLLNGAILFQVPKGSGGATIRTAAVTAAITGTTGVLEFHPASGSNPPISKCLCLEGHIRLFLPDGQSVELGPGQMTTTDGTNFTQVVDFDIARFMETALLVTGFEGQLASANLIAFHQQEQVNLRVSGGVIDTSTVSLLDPNKLLDILDQGLDAQEAAQGSPFPTVSPSPTITPTPTVTPTPEKFGTPTVIVSSNPYIIDGDTEIQTDPSITNNGLTDFGKIYRGKVQDGDLSTFVFGSTTSSDVVLDNDNEFGFGGGIAVFKFTSLQLTGDPTISTTGGPDILGLIAINDITSGGPGGVLTFAGIRRLLLATQNGSINLGSEISFSGLDDITFYVRAAGSNLTLASDVITKDMIRLVATGGIQLGSDLITQTLNANTNGDFDFTAGSIDAQTIFIVAGGDINFTLGTPLSFNTDSFLLQADGNLHVDNSLEVTATKMPFGTIVLHAGFSSAGGNLSVEGNLSLTTDRASIVVDSAGDITIGGAFTLFVDAAANSTTVNGGNITVTSGGSLIAGNLDFDLFFDDSDSVTNGENLTLNLAGNLTTTSTGGVNLRLSTPVNNSLNGGGNLRLTVGGDLSIGAGQALTMTLINTVSTMVSNGANLSASVGGDLSAGPISLLLDNSTDGGIGTGGNISFTTGGNLSADSIDALIDNRDGGSIASGGTMTFEIGGRADVAGDAIFEILGSDGVSTAAIEFNGGSYGVGGTFRSFIDGSGTIAFNNASIAADVLKVGALGTNGVLNIGGGTLSADTELKLYAPGSNGQLNFVSDVTLGGNSRKILAANSITIFDDVAVTIGGKSPAEVYTNNANYSSDFGGNDSTTGTFDGAGASDPQPLDSAPPFDDVVAPEATAGSKRQSVDPRRPSRTNVTSTGRSDRDFKTRKKGTDGAIKVSDSGQLLSLLDGAVVGPGGKIAIPAPNHASNRENSSRMNVAARLNADRSAANIRGGSSSPASRLLH